MPVFQEFWMVLSDAAPYACPSVRHKTESAAKKEAARLANANDGVKFFVLKTIAACVKADVEWSTAEDLPF